ncbi:hypothetical protein M404DRAFT_246331 [Pisolithus tinctorius Marx 270]|uniref:Uncharacterized protein n=1 Tax=Pisolithus tinctorius Marx 270 TaxID=870435 RepID=A0A0C3IHB7_PISTI|nr:hypothetical protein M404DRAFT_246331 [Pisolithus tinctorius Marx 270]
MLLIDATQRVDCQLVSNGLTTRRRAHMIQLLDTYHNSKTKDDSTREREKGENKHISDMRSSRVTHVV